MSKYYHFINNYKFWNHSEDYIYHYTTSANASSINTSNEIKINPREAEFERGIFFTTIPPRRSDNEILENLFGPSILTSSEYELFSPKLECAFAFKKYDIKNLSAVQGYRLNTGHFKSSDNIDLQDLYNNKKHVFLIKRK